MAGGTFLTQNKMRPGAYINFKSKSTPLGTVGERGTIALPLALSWGESKTLLTLETETLQQDSVDVLGYSITTSELLLLREASKKAKRILVYRVNIGEKASKTEGTLLITARCGGVRGNAITIKIVPDVNLEGGFVVSTYVDGTLQGQQSAKTVEQLKDNKWVSFGGTGPLKLQAGILLTGGTDGVASTQDYLDFLTAVETQNFECIALPLTDQTIKTACIAFAKRMRETEGKKIQLIAPDCANADYEGVISVKNGVVLDDGTVLDAAKATAYVAGLTAGAQVNQSNTYAVYDGAIDVDIRYTNSQIEAALQSGEFVFVERQGKAVVEQDINTFTTITTQKGETFRHNRSIRVLDGIGNDLQKIYEQYYIGKVDNDSVGQNLLKAEIIRYMQSLQALRAIKNFDGSQDVSVTQGASAESIVAEVAVQPVEAAEKLYMTVTVQ